MAFLLYEQETADSTVKDITDLAPPPNATGVQFQADTNHVRYTMDGTLPTVSSGMLFLFTEPPETFTVGDAKNIKFIRDGVTNAQLNAHWFAGRDI